MLKVVFSGACEGENWHSKHINLNHELVELITSCLPWLNNHKARKLHWTLKKKKKTETLGDSVPLTCLSLNVDTGKHVNCAPPWETWEIAVLIPALLGSFVPFSSHRTASAHLCSTSLSLPGLHPGSEWPSPPAYQNPHIVPVWL